MAFQFEHVAPHQRVLFGSGTAAAHLAAEASRLDALRAMLISSPRDSTMARNLAAGVPVVLDYHGVAQHVPSAKAVAARDAASSHDVDLLIAVGGGSAIGLAKAIALTTGLPIIAVPTSYAGSEATDVWGITEQSRKSTGVDDRVLPSAVIYDVTLTYSLPVRLSVTSGLNAMAHCIDALWAPRANPINAALASEGMGLLARGLPAVSATPSGSHGREQALCGAYLAAASFASAGAGLHHKICHVLGGTFNLPHAEVHAVVLPHVTAFNVPTAPDAGRRIATALASSEALAGLTALYEALDAPSALRDLGFNEDQIPAAAKLILPTVPPSNPRRVGTADLERLLHAAWAGTNPAQSGA